MSSECDMMGRSGFVNIIVFCRDASSKKFSKMNPYNLKKINQDKLVEEISAQFEVTILKPLHREQKDTLKSSLKDNLDYILQETEKLYNSIIEEKLIKRHNALLNHRGFSALSAYIEAHEPKRVKEIFEKIVLAENASLQGKEAEAIGLSWQDYFDSAYGEFWRNLKKLLPEGPHSEFYKKRVSDRKNKQHARTQNQRKSDKVNIKPARDAAKSPSPKKRAASQTKPDSSKPQEDYKKVEPVETVTEIQTPSISQIKQEFTPSPTPTPRTRLKYEDLNSTKTNPNMTATSIETSKPSARERPLPKEKISGIPNAILDEQSNPVEATEVRKPDPPKPTHEPPKPKKNLLEQMQELSKSKIEKAQVSKTEISYPPIFTKKSWKKYWSNSDSTKGSGWDQFFWNCNSIGKSYLMKDKNRDKLQREYDVNQDFAVANPGRNSLRVLLFDGVSQSRAPRQWAECLAETYIKNRLSISKLKSHAEDLEEWHTTSREMWDKWIEDHYLPQRQHLPEWRLKNEKNRSYTTFLAIEIDSKMVRIANIGDSAIFCKFKSGAIRHLPTTYNHLLRPKNISTIKLYNQDDIEFYEFKVDSLESLLACTDSIADYIFDEDEKSMRMKYDQCIKELSTKGDKFEFISKMIALGPSKGGWLEDDVTFFSLVRNESNKSIDGSLENIQKKNNDTGGESE